MLNNSKLKFGADFLTGGADMIRGKVEEVDMTRQRASIVAWAYLVQITVYLWDRNKIVVEITKKRNI